VQHGDLLQVEDQAVLVHNAFWGPGSAARVADYERVVERYLLVAQSVTLTGER
jgi:hypothetical protein